MVYSIWKITGDIIFTGIYHCYGKLQEILLLYKYFLIFITGNTIVIENYRKNITIMEKLQKIPLLWKITKKCHYYGIYHCYEKLQYKYFYHRKIPLLWNITEKYTIIENYRGITMVLPCHFP